jgi:hypothetical protein
MWWWGVHNAFGFSWYEDLDFLSANHSTVEILVLFLVFHCILIRLLLLYWLLSHLYYVIYEQPLNMTMVLILIPYNVFLNQLNIITHAWIRCWQLNWPLAKCTVYFLLQSFIFCLGYSEKGHFCFSHLEKLYL